MARKSIEAHGSDVNGIADHLMRQLSVYISGGKVEPADPLERVLLFIADTFEVTVVDIISKSRKWEHIFARHTAAYILYNYFTRSNKGAGQKLGGRDHSTIVNSRRVVSDLMDTDKVFRDKCEKCVTFAKNIIYNNDRQRQETEPDPEYPLGHA